MEYAINYLNNHNYLDEILEENDLTIFDSCAFTGSLDAKRIDKERSPEYYEIQNEFQEMLLELYDSVGNLCTTEGVAKEMLNTRLPYKKVIKSYEIQNDAVARKSFSLRNSAQNKSKDLVKQMKKDNRIISLSDDKFILRLLKQAGRYLIDDFGISKTDYELILATASRTSQGANIALVTNDFGIIKAFKRLDFRAKKFDLDISHSANIYFSESLGTYLKKDF